MNTQSIVLAVLGYLIVLSITLAIAIAAGEADKKRGMK